MGLKQINVHYFLFFFSVIANLFLTISSGSIQGLTGDYSEFELKRLPIRWVSDSSATYTALPVRNLRLSVHRVPDSSNTCTAIQVQVGNG